MCHIVPHPHPFGLLSATLTSGATVVAGEGVVGFAGGSKGFAVVVAVGVVGVVVAVDESLSTGMLVSMRSPPFSTR